MSYSIPFLEIHAVDHCNHTCRWCHNFSPYAPAREYSASEYYEGLDILFKNGVSIDRLSIMGGEPFLHSKLTEFAIDLYNRYARPFIITTNGFWLTEENIMSFSLLLKMVHHFKMSRYATINKRLGGDERIKELLGLIKQINPYICIDYPDKANFNSLDFFTEPHEITANCWNINCMGLLTDTRIGHCSIGYNQQFAPKGMIPGAFANDPEMFYNLQNFTMESFIAWKEKYPLEACRYCNLAQKTRSKPWRALKGSKVFRENYEKAFEINQCRRKLAAEGKMPQAKRLQELSEMLTREESADGLV